jgi:hypothetical protein
MTFFGVTERTARIEHRCAESRCRRTGHILPGTRYVVLSGVWDGHAWSEKLCLRCNRAHDRARDRFGPWNEDEGPGIGELLSWLQEARFYGYETRTQRQRREDGYRHTERRLDLERDLRAASIAVRSGP